MSPEQALDTKHADARADIYSLGCTLYYLLTGGPVFVGSTLMARMLAHRETSIPSLVEARPGVPKELDAIFKKMVAKEPADRYQTGAELLEALETIQVEGEEVESEPSVAVETHIDAASKETSSAQLDETIGPTAVPKEEIPAPTPATVSKGRGTMIGGIVAAAAFLVGGIYLAAVIFRVEVDGGTVLVEIGDSDKPVEVTVTKDDTIKIIDPNDGKEVLVTVEAGANKLTLRKEGFEVETETFSLKSEDGRHVKVSFVPVKEVAAVAADESYRRAAQWVLSNGGKITLGGGDRLGAKDKLPEVPFRVVRVELEAGTEVNGDDLATLKPLVDLEMLDFEWNQTFDGSGLKHLTSQTRLRQLVLAFSQVTDEAIESLPNWPLTLLDLQHTPTTDATIAELRRFPTLETLATGKGITNKGFQRLADIRSLRSLSIGDKNPHVSDETLQFVGKLTQLTQLSVRKSPISDSGLKHLYSLGNLRSLNLQGTQVTAEGVAKLQEALPDCEIFWDGNPGGYTCSTDMEQGYGNVDREVAKYVLGRRGAVYVCPVGVEPKWDEGQYGGIDTSNWIASMEQLPRIPIVLYGADIERPTVEDVSHFVVCRDLERQRDGH
jgi:hypothetical protein